MHVCLYAHVKNRGEQIIWVGTVLLKIIYVLLREQ
jgi:hypothetical protein